MYCFKCGKEISSDMLYCPYCGNKTINENNKTDKKKDTDTKIKESKQNAGLVVQQEKTHKVDIDIKNVFRNICLFIYNARKVIFSILYTTLILLFFCNFLKLNMFGVEITKVNGFTAIKYLFNGDFFDNIANNNLDLSSVKTLIQMAYFIYFVLLVLLVESLIANIVALIKKENAVNKLNFVNSIGIFFASIFITILYFVIKKDFIDLYGNLFTYSSGVLAIAVVSIITLAISIWCRFSKNNNEVNSGKHVSFINFFSLINIVIYLSMIIICFMKVSYISVNEIFAYNFFELVKISLSIKKSLGILLYLSLMLVTVGFISNLICLITNKKSICNNINIGLSVVLFITQIIIFITKTGHFSSCKFTFTFYFFIIGAILLMFDSFIYAYITQNKSKKNAECIENDIMSPKFIKVICSVVSSILIIMELIFIVVSKPNEDINYIKQMQSTFVEGEEVLNNYSNYRFDNDIDYYLVRSSEDTFIPVSSKELIEQNSKFKNAQLSYIKCIESNDNVSYIIENEYGTFNNSHKYLIYIKLKNKTYYAYSFSPEYYSFTSWLHEDGNRYATDYSLLYFIESGE